MQQFSYLIADPSTGRTVLKQLLNQWKVPPARIRAMDSIDHAKRELEASTPNVAVLDGALLEGTAIIANYDQTRLEDSEPRILIVLAQKGTSAYLDALLDDRVDGVISKPFTLQSLSEQLGTILRAKTQPNPYEKAIEVGRALRRAGKNEKASQVFVLAEKLNPAPALACWHQGDIARAAGDFETALAQFKRGISFQKDHLRSVVGAMNACFRLGHDAAGAVLAQFLFENKILPASCAPGWARAALKRGKHDIFPRLFDYLNAMQALAGDPGRALVEGLIAHSGDLLAAGDLKGAALAMKRAELCAQGDPTLLARILAGLLKLEMLDEAKAMVGRVPPEISGDPEVRAAELWLVSRNGPAVEVLQRALDMLKSGVRSREIFKLAIEKSRELNRRPEVIEDLVHQARKLFPDAAEFLET